MDSTADYDVIILGGAFSGAASGILLRRWMPNARVLIVEKLPAFSRKVGEATVEISSYFLHKVLGLYDHLSREHLPKHGLRYWYHDHPERDLHRMAEVGPDEIPLLPAFQLDRARMDEHLLATAVAEGCALLRPARVTAVEPGWPLNTVQVETADGARALTARWLIDATGRRALLAKQLGVHQRVDRHPTAALWGRFSGVTDLDGVDVIGRDPRAPRLPDIKAARRLATNHFCGYGYWCWAIPLAPGETSVGVVYHKELLELPDAPTAAERFERFVRSEPGLRELLAHAELDRDDFLTYGHLPYRATRYADRGWALVGDAASFIDPYYSPGLDHASMSIYATCRLIEDELTGRLDDAALGARLDTHNGQFHRSYDRWIEALYLGKYEYIGDAELGGAAALWDTGMYYMGVVSPVYRDIEALANPAFGPDVFGAKAAWWLMRFINRRLVHLARFRRATGNYGARNTDWRVLVRSPGLERAAAPFIRQAAGIWLQVEREYWWTRLRRGLWRMPLREPVPKAPAARSAAK
ncbi:MAG: tryptophan 7-halogenase [Alphaproteobacteria bacterium]|nr:tryptophan 7-halogenase [Alphaproteobacteria bacterium]